MKMYILIRDSIPIGFALLAAAHASLAAYLKFRETPEVEQWLADPFYKTICRVNDAEFETAKTFDDYVLISEPALDGQEVAIAFQPRSEWPRPFRFYALYR